MTTTAPQRFRKKPVEVDAMQVPDTDDMLAWGAIGAWLNIHSVDFAIAGPDDGPFEGIDILTLEGTMRADLGDWIIRGVAGEFYPCKPGIFADTYDRVAQ